MMHISRLAQFLVCGRGALSDSYVLLQLHAKMSMGFTK